MLIRNTSWWFLTSRMPFCCFSTFLLLGYPDPSQQDTVSFDKLEDMVISYYNRILGTMINTRCIDVETHPEFVAATKTLLKDKWNRSRRQWIIKDLQVLTGKLHHISDTSLWLKFLMSHMYMPTACALKCTYKHLIHTNSQYRNMLKQTIAKETSNMHQSYALSESAKTLHSSNSNTTRMKPSELS